MSWPLYEEYKHSGLEWLGEIPEHWGVRTISSLSTKITNGYVGPTRDILVDHGVRYLQSLHIKNNHIRFDTPYFVREDWSKEHAKSILENGDVLIVQTGDIGQVAVVTSEYAGCNCHALIIVSPLRSVVRGEWIAWVLNSAYGRQSLLSIQTGALHPHLNCGNVKGILMPVPSISEQVVIAAFLDREIAKIDALAAEQERLIELLKEKRRAVISHAVTKGLDITRPLKQSVFDPDRFLPVDWIESRLATVCTFKSGKAHEPYFNEDGPYVCVTARFISTDGDARKYCSENFTPTSKGDILMVMSDLPNGRALARAFLVDDETSYAVNQRACVISVLNGNPRFFFYQLNRNYQLLRYDDGVNQTHLPNEAFTKLLLLVPSLSEQNAIVTFLDGEAYKIDRLIGEAETAMSLLSERRVSLISAAVTGKIDVRGLVEADASVSNVVAA
jgi:restriction endonuclease S subunit